MPNRNLMTAIGHLARDPEVRYLPNGNALCNLTVACTDKWKGKDGEWKESTEWVKASIFGDVAELVVEMFKKGDAIHLEGKQVTRKWTDKEGNERYSTELNANYVAKPVYAKKKVETKAPSYNGIPDSDIPFMQPFHGGLWRSV